MLEGMTRADTSWAEYNSNVTALISIAFYFSIWAEQKQVGVDPCFKCWKGSSKWHCELSVHSGSSLGKIGIMASSSCTCFFVQVMFHLSSSFNLSYSNHLCQYACMFLVCGIMKSEILWCSSNPLYEYVNIFLNGYILAKHYIYYILIVFQGWSSHSCAQPVTSTINLPKLWTSEIWGLRWRSSLMWNVIVWYQVEVTFLLGLYGVMVEWLLVSRRKAKKESMVKIL